MKLEVGMYVRTKRGQIGKIITIGNITLLLNLMACGKILFLKKIL